MVQSLAGAHFHQKFMDKPAVARKIVETGIIPVIRADSRDEAHRLIDALKSGGIDVFEVTLTVPQAIDLIAEIAGSSPDMLIGAGTVLDEETARKCIDAGAKFIVSPVLNFEIISLCREKKSVVIAGALTPTEILAAWKAGADFVKVFPVSTVGGASYLKAVKAPLPHIRFIPTGGISLENAASFIRAGAEALGVGGELVDLNAIRSNRPETVAEKARQFREIIQNARKLF